MRYVACLLPVSLAFLAILTACDAPEPTDLRVGAHVFSVHFPEEWEHFDYGEQHQFRKDFERITLEDSRLSGRNLEKSAEIALVQFREDGRREVASSRHVLVGGRDALAIDTWDHLSHEFRKSYVFVNNQGDLLVIYMMQGRFEAMDAAFGELLASVAFPDSLDAAGGTVPRGRN